MGTILGWLNSRGGRTEEDLEKDKGGYYVMMGRNKDEKVYLPKGIYNDLRG